MPKLLVYPCYIILFTLASPAVSQSFDLGGLPALTSDQNPNGEITYSLSLQVLALMTAVTLLPSLVLGMTSFTRIIIVLSILRQALGTQQTPPNQVLIAIALFLSLFIMQPTLTEIYNVALSPFLSETMSAEVAILEASTVIKDFMVVNTRSDTLLMFSDMAGADGYESNADIPFSTLLPSFITSELKTAFQIGFLLFVPFLVIDLVVAAILMAMGMMMLSPIIISLPFKLMLFVLIDGWALVTSTLVRSFAV